MAEIMGLQQASLWCQFQKQNGFTVGLVSGGFDPIHDGHTYYITQAARRCDLLIVIVNGDWFLEQKKGAAFMPLSQRAAVVSCLRGVDVVVPYAIEGDSTVVEPLKWIQPTYFFKGGDRTGIENIPEWKTCETLGIEVVTGIGGGKIAASSDLLYNWGEKVLGALDGNDAAFRIYQLKEGKVHGWQGSPALGRIRSAARQDREQGEDDQSQPPPAPLPTETQSPS